MVFGFGGTIEYKGFDLSAYFTGAARTSTFFEDRTFWPFASGMGFFNVFKEIYDNRWTPETAGAAKYPVVTDGFNVQSMRRSTVWQKDASYLRLKNLNIGYDLPMAILRPLGITHAQVFANATNLFCISAVSEFLDP